MVTLEQMVAALAHADEWPDELMRLRNENADLRRQLEAERARANAATAKADFYFQLTVDATKERK